MKCVAAPVVRSFFSIMESGIVVRGVVVSVHVAFQLKWTVVVFPLLQSCRSVPVKMFCKEIGICAAIIPFDRVFSIRKCHSVGGRRPVHKSIVLFWLLNLNIPPVISHRPHSILRARAKCSDSRCCGFPSGGAQPSATPNDPAAAARKHCSV